MPVPKDVEVEWVFPGVGLIQPPAGHPGAASMVIEEGGEVVVVDAGLAPTQRRKLSPHVDVCLLTHCHVAHAHGARDYREVWAPKVEARAMESAEDHLHAYGVARRDHDLVASAIRRAGYEPSPVHKRYSPGGLIVLGEHEWRLVHAPGHSPGLTLLLDPERHILFASDLDGEGPPWYGFPTSDPTQLESTLGQLAEIPVAAWITSHAPVRRRGIKPMLKAMAETIRERDRQVLAALEHPRTLDELADLGLFTGRSAEPLRRYHERVMVEKHLARLLEKDFAHARQDGRFMRLT